MQAGVRDNSSLRNTGPLKPGIIELGIHYLGVLMPVSISFPIALCGEVAQMSASPCRIGCRGIAGRVDPRCLGKQSQPPVTPGRGPSGAGLVPGL